MKLPTYKSLEEKKKYFWPFIQVDTIEAFEKEFKRLGTIENHLGELPNAEKLYDTKRDLVVFRGMSEAKYKLYTSAQREWLTQDLNKVLGKDGFVDFIESILSNLRINNNLEGYLESMNLAMDDPLLLSFLQHYGGPTSFLDFTCDKNIALFFATEKLFGADQGGEDIENYFSIYVHPVDEQLVDYLDQYYNNMDKVVQKGTPIGIVWKKKKTDPSFVEELSVNDPVKKPRLSYIRTPPRTERMEERETKKLRLWSNPNIIAQQGCFILNPSPIDPLEHLYYVRNNQLKEEKRVAFLPNLKCLNIHKSLAPYIREEYLKSNKITKETIYPDFYSIAQGAYEAFKRNPTAKISPANLPDSKD
jgi:FRG domain